MEGAEEARLGLLEIDHASSAQFNTHSCGVELNQLFMQLTKLDKGRKNMHSLSCYSHSYQKTLVLTEMCVHTLYTSPACIYTKSSKPSCFCNCVGLHLKKSLFLRVQFPF